MRKLPYHHYMSFNPSWVSRTKYFREIFRSNVNRILNRINLWECYFHFIHQPRRNVVSNVIISRAWKWFWPFIIILYRIMSLNKYPRSRRIICFSRWRSDFLIAANHGKENLRTPLLFKWFGEYSKTSSCPSVQILALTRTLQIWKSLTQESFREKIDNSPLSVPQSSVT